MLKSRIFILFLCLLFGWIGVHRFYIRRRITGFILLLLFFFWVLTGNTETGAFFFIPLTLWWLFDIFMIIVGRLKDKDGTIPRWFGQSQKKNIVAEEIEGKKIQLDEGKLSALSSNEIEIFEAVGKKDKLRRIINSANQQLKKNILTAGKVTDEHVTGIFVIDIAGTKFVCLDIAFENEGTRLDNTIWSKIAFFITDELNKNDFFLVFKKEFGVNIPSGTVICSSSGIAQHKLEIYPETT
jgi:TM2 domain-containing membrane protein YozV